MSEQPRPGPGPDEAPDDGAGAQPAPPPEEAPVADPGPPAAEDAPPTSLPEQPATEDAPPTSPPEQPAPGPMARLRRRRDPLAAALIGVLTLLLGFAFAVQVRTTGTGEGYSALREEDLVRILDDLDAREDRLRAQIADQRTALRELNSDDSQSEAALQETQERAEALGILNGTVAAQGPGLLMTVRDPEGRVRVADLLDAIQELRGAGAETMQIDGVRVGVSTAVTGEPGQLRVDGSEVDSPYEIRVIGSPQDLETAMNIPGGVVDRVGRQGGTVDIEQSETVVVDALRQLDRPQYAQPDTDAGD
jgi:uncharacterized protein YlxW (UPF0749 family)